MMKRTLLKGGKYILGPFLAGAASFVTFKYYMYKSNLTTKQ